MFFALIVVGSVLATFGFTIIKDILIVQ